MVVAASAVTMQNALDPAAMEAARIAHLWWLFFWVLMMVFALVAIFLFFAILRNRRPAAAPEITDKPEPQDEARLTSVVMSAVIVTVLTLFVLLVIDFFTGHAVYSVSEDPNALEIKITGHQWWWEVQYQDPQPSNIMTTANEVHIPIGRTIKLDLSSDDVIHSLWIPNFNGKKDLIPGQPTSTYIIANREGEFRGQCAEYCGEQHAHMRLVFVAEKPEKFEQWLNARRQSSLPPQTETQRRGRELFVTSQCVMCHTVQGTNARAALGPDLTHIASREWLAAGALPNTRLNMARWISNPQDYKPAARMPANPFPPDALNALLDYLESLK